METETLDAARNFARERLNEFKPFAYYDKHLDCIRVQIRDCSMLEDRKNPIFTVLKANHASDKTSPGDLVGLNIKGVRHLFEKLGLSRQACYQMADVIDALFVLYPETSVKEIRDKFAPVMRAQNLQVQLELSAA